MPKSSASLLCLATVCFLAALPATAGRPARSLAEYAPVCDGGYTINGLCVTDYGMDTKESADSTEVVFKKFEDTCTWTEEARAFAEDAMECAKATKFYCTIYTALCTAACTALNVLTEKWGKECWSHGGNVADYIPAPPSVCFPANANVQVNGGHMKRMDELAIGDSVLVADASTGAMTYEPVYFFGHRLHGKTSIFVSVCTDGGKCLRLTPDHHLPVCAVGTCTEWADFHAVPASTVCPGQTVLQLQGGNTSTALVTSVDRIVDTGLFNPYTTGGYIVVDGTVASVHSSWILDGLFNQMGVSLPAGYQVVFAPLRGLYAVAGSGVMSAIQVWIIDGIADLTPSIALLRIASTAYVVAVGIAMAIKRPTSNAV